MSRLLAFLVFLFATLACALVAAPALAQQAEITATVDANEIELGDSVTYTLTASSPGRETPSDPKLAVPQGFTLVDSGASPSQMMSIVNGRVSEKRSLTAQWRLRADRLGTFSIGPGSVNIGGARKSGTPQTVKVVAPGAGRPKPRRPRGGGGIDPFGGSPFDPFKGLFPGFDDEPTPTVREPAVTADPKLSLDVPRAPGAFLHALVDKKSAVVGEQVTLSVYLYEDLYSQVGRTSDVHEATAADFVKHSLLQDETRATYVGTTMIQGKPWTVKLVRKNALFPIKVGRLSISPMSLTLPQARLGLRESETLYVDVSEPPMGGRPAGYQVGDTGDFSLSASIAPRTIEQHGAVGVTVELRGTGNLPSTLPTPEVAGVEWLEPQTRETLGPQSSERYGGTRTFSFVARVHKAGAVDLGEIRLPYYDPQTRRYGVARTALGIVEVTPGGPAHDAGAEIADEVLPNLPKPRAELEGKRATTYMTERPADWGFLFGAPLACASAIALAGAARKVRQRRASAAPSPSRIAKERRSEAEAAARGSDGGASVAATVRAVEASVLASVGVNLRGTSGESSLKELALAGVAEDTAKRIVGVLRGCEDARFSPTGVAIETARELWDRARVTLDALDEDEE